MEQIITYKELETILENNHYKNIADFAKKFLLGKFVKMNLTASEVAKIINGANKKAILSATDHKYVKVSLIKQIGDALSDADIELYNRLDEITQIFKQYHKDKGLKQSYYTEGMRACWELSRRVNKTINDEVVAFTKEELNTFEILAKIYRAVVEHVNDEKIKALFRETTHIESQDGTLISKHQMVEKEFVRVADYIVSARLAELKDSTLSKLKEENVVQFRGFLEAIRSEKEDNKRDTFTKDEVKQLLDKTISLISLASAEKYNSVRDCINIYIDAVKEMDFDKNSKEYEEFSKLTAKSIILKCGSLVSKTKETVSFSLDFVMGKKMSDAGKKVVNLSESKTSLTAKYAKLLQQDYPNLRFRDMDIAGHLYFAKHSPSHISSLTTQTVYNMTNSLLDVVLLGYGEDITDLTILDKKVLLKQKGFDIDAIYGRDNLYEIFSGYFIKQMKAVNGKCREVLVQNIKTLTQYIVAADIQKLVSHNFNFLLIDNEKMLQAIEEIKVKSAGDNKLFYKLFHEMINDKYFVDAKSSEILRSKIRGLDDKEKLVNEDTEEDADAPEKEFITVRLIGIEDVDEDVLEDLKDELKDDADDLFDEDVDLLDVVKEIPYMDLYESLSSDLINLKNYALASNNEDILVGRKQFDAGSVADLIAGVSLGSNPTNKTKFKKTLQKLIQGLCLIQTYPEFEQKDIRYFKNLVEEIVNELKSRRNKLVEERKNVDTRISTNFETKEDKEARKKARKERNSKEYTQALVEISKVRNSRLLAKFYPNLINPNVADDIMLDSEIISEEDEKIRNYRKPKQGEKRESDVNISTDLEKTNLLSKEIEFIDLIVDGVNGMDFKKVKAKRADAHVEITESEILSRLDELKKQRKLKMRTIKSAFNQKIRQGEYSLEKDIAKIVGDDPRGVGHLREIEKIDAEIADLEEKLSLLSSSSTD